MGGARVSHRALVVIPAENGWLRGETTWRDDRTGPGDGWRPPEPRSIGADSFRSVVESFDFARFDGIYRRDGDGWTAFLACWLAVEHYLGESIPDPRGDGAVVAIRSPRDGTALRIWFRGAKATVAEGVRANELSIVEGRKRLLSGLRRRAGERDVIVGSPRE